MTAKELMIGDLVRVNKDVSIKKDIIVEIHAIDADRNFQELKGCATCVPVNDPDGFSGGVWLNYLSPIPLTSELLEEKGFKRVPQPGCTEPYHWELAKYEDDIIDRSKLLYHIKAYNTPFRGMFVSIDNPSACETISFGKQVEHVHELQHAFRLCDIGIDL